MEKLQKFQFLYYCNTTIVEHTITQYTVEIQNFWIWVTIHFSLTPPDVYKRQVLNQFFV